jgi:hypothetical protein
LKTNRLRRQEVRGLTLVGAEQIEAVVRTDGYVGRLVPVVVHVAEQHGERSVGVLLPSFERRVDGLAL